MSDPAWVEINRLFERHGVALPPTPLRDDLVGHLLASRRALAAEAEAARLRELIEEASDAMRMPGLAMEAPLGRVTKKHIAHWTSLFHGTSERLRAALKDGGGK